MRASHHLQEPSQPSIPYRQTVFVPLLGRRSCASTAQALDVLQELNQTLVDLMSEGGSSLVSGKVEQERLRKLFMLYCRRLYVAFTSPKYCYFGGFKMEAPNHLLKLKDHVRHPY